MKTVLFSTKPYEWPFFETANEPIGHDLEFLEVRLSQETASLAAGYPCVCAFVSDDLAEPVLQTLSEGGTRFIALRSAGFNHVDLQAADRLGLRVVRVPAYSPNAVAEHTVGLMLALNRQLYRAYNRVREGNFALSGLLGFDMAGKTVGVVGTGNIGTVTARILHGFSCSLLGHDVAKNPECEKLGMRYVALDELLQGSDIVTLHCPLTPETHHLIDRDAIETMKRGVMLVNTSRGGVVDTAAVIQGLKSGRIGKLGLDVYEEEGDFFFRDLSGEVIQDDQLARLLTFPNVIVTGHQAFFTEEALEGIADTTLENIRDLEEHGRCQNEVTLREHSE